jgi:Core-2/I-Branching enzyme
VRFAYLVMAHNMPAQLDALIDRLTDGEHDDRVVLHLDRKSALWRNDRARLAAHPSGKVVLVERPVYAGWAHWSQVAAQHRTLGAGIATGCDYLHLISGADWPVVSRARMVADIAASGPSRPAFSAVEGAQMGKRMDHWWFDDRRLALPGWPRLSENIVRAQTRFSMAFSTCLERIGVRRARVAGQPWLKGSSWFSLPQDIATDIHAETGRLLANGRLLFTRCADEHVMQTLLGRRHADRIAADKRYIDWSAGGNNPKLLRRDDAPAILASGAWFARKLDMAIDDFFLDPAAFTNPAPGHARRPA